MSTAALLFLVAAVCCIVSFCTHNKSVIRQSLALGIACFLVSMLLFATHTN